VTIIKYGPLDISTYFNTEKVSCFVSHPTSHQHNIFYST